MKALLLALLAAGPAGAVTTAGRMPVFGATARPMAPPVLPPSALLSVSPALSAPTFSAPVLLARPAASAPVPAAPAAVPRPTAFSPGAIALVQYDGDSRFGDYEHNLRELTRLAEEAVAKGAKIIVTPEGSLYGYASKDELWCKPGMMEFKGRRCRDVSRVAEPVPGGRSAEYWAAFSRRHGVFVLFNVPENDGGTFYNTMGVTGPSGFTARYRKRMLYRTDEAYASAGAEPTVLKTDYGCFGLLICLDAHPQSPYFQEYKDLEVNALIIAMDWDDDPAGAYAAKLKFREWAGEQRLDIYASDAAPWDGAGKYPASGAERERDGLPPDAVGVAGVSIHRVKY